MKVIPVTTCALLLVGLGLARLGLSNEPAPLINNRTVPVHMAVVRTPIAELAPILAENDTERRHARLRAWADGIETSRMESLLSEIQHHQSPFVRSELRQALLFSWTSRDLVAVAKWFGTLEPHYELHQEGRDQLVLALLQCNPADVLPVLQTSLPVSTAQELCGPYFQAWAATAPDAAANTLLQLANGERKGAAAWEDLISQVTAQWMQSDPDRAIAWVQAMPEGAGKTKAELQTSYRWTELNPVAAAAYAGQKNNAQLIQTVACKWAETNPKAAVAWAASLATEMAQSHALAGAGTSWAQQDPLAAAAYATRLGESPQRVAFTAAVTSAWACSDPAEAAKWLQTLPTGESRNHALTVLAAALPQTSPERAWGRSSPLTPTTP